MARIASEMGRAEEAVASAREAVRLSPENSSYLLSLGWYAYEAGDLAESIAASRRAIALTPNEPMALFNLGLALLAAGEAQAAFKEYAAGLKVCAKLELHEASLNLEGAMGDLDRLSQSRSNLAPIVADIKRTLQTHLNDVKQVRRLGNDVK
jgi:tetratricopeptide (TPR) repeat protein